MHYLGKLKQRSFVCKVEETQILTAGEKVVDSEGKTVGNIVNAINGFDHSLVSLRFDNLDNGLVTESGAALQVLGSQPYDLKLND